MKLFELSKDQVKELREDLAYGHHIPFTTNPDDITDKMLIETYGDTDFSNDDFMAKPRECAENYEVAVDFEETEWCANCDNESTIFWDIRKDGFRAYCPHCGERLTLCDACMHRFGEFHEEWSDCGNCPVNDDGFIEDDVYDWGDICNV